MPIDVVRSVTAPRIARLVRRILCIAATSVLAAACGDDGLAPPGDARLAKNAEGRTAGPGGLEHRLPIRVDPTPNGRPYRAHLTATSVLVNTGSTPVRLTARECLFFDEDVEASARVDRFEPAISCGAVSSTGDLRPGESTSTMQVQLGVRSGPGIYTLKLRHALSPEFRGEVSFLIQ